MLDNADMVGTASPKRQDLKRERKRGPGHSPLRPQKHLCHTQAQVESAQCLLPTPSATSLAQARCHCPLRTRLIGGTCVDCLCSFPAQAPTHPRPQLVQTRSRRAMPLICPPPHHPSALPFLPSEHCTLSPQCLSHTAQTLKALSPHTFAFLPDSSPLDPPEQPHNLVTRGLPAPSSKSPSAEPVA